MATRRADPLRILLDVDLSSHALIRFLTNASHDVVAAGVDPDLRQLDDPILFAVAHEQSRILITHNFHDFPDILRDWIESGRTHSGCIVSFVPTNAFAEMEQRLDDCFRRLPLQRDWVDRTIYV